MTTKAAFLTAAGGSLMPLGQRKEFVRTSGNILTATAHGLQTGAGPFKIMTTNADAPLNLVAAVHASLAYTPATDIENETITIDGKVYTWKNSPSADGELDVNATAATAAENLANAINLGPGAGTAYGVSMKGNPRVRAEAQGAACVVYAKTLDHTVGNAIAVAEAAAGSWAGGGTLLANGASGTSYYIVRLSADTFSLATSKANALAGTVVTIDDAGTGVHMLVPIASTLADAAEDVVVNFLTHVGARTLPASIGVANFWQALIDGVAN